MSPLTVEQVTLITDRAERYARMLKIEINMAQAVADYPEAYTEALHRVTICQQDAAAALYLARLANYELSAQSKP